MATMGGLRYGGCEDERDNIAGGKRGWNNQHSGRRGGGGVAHDDGWVFDGSRWIRHSKGWCRVPSDRKGMAEDDKKKKDIDHEYYQQAMKKGPSTCTVLQSPPRTVQLMHYYKDDDKEYKDVDALADAYIRRNHEKFLLASQMEYCGYY